MGSSDPPTSFDPKYITVAEADAVLSRLETMLGHDLPEDYKRFQRARDQNDDYRTFFKYMHPRGPRRLGLHTLFPLLPDWGDDHPFVMMKLFREREDGHGRVPANAAVVAVCTEPEVVLLYFRGRHRGMVAVKTWETLEDDGVDNPNDNVYVIARSWDRFLSMLHETIPDDES